MAAAWINLWAGAIYLLNPILAWILSLPFIQSAIDSAGILLAWIGAIWDLLTSVLNLFGLALGFLGALLHLIVVAYQAMLTGMSAASPISFPFPDCTNSTDPLYSACIPLDVVNYLFSQIPFMAVYLNVAVFAVAWRQVRKTWRVAQEVFTT
jgi:hypothetical protein